METHIRNARVLTPDGALAETGVTVAGGRIATVGERPPAGARVIEAGGLLLPGIVDLHGDAFERQLDLVLIDDAMPELPRVVDTLVAGRAVFAGRELT